MDVIVTDSEVETRSIAEIELDLPTDSLSKIISFKHFYQHYIVIETDDLKSDEEQTLQDVAIDEMTPLKTES